MAGGDVSAARLTLAGVLLLIGAGVAFELLVDRSLGAAVYLGALVALLFLGAGWSLVRGRSDQGKDRPS